MKSVGAGDDEYGRREIDHTADLGFEVWAPDVEGLFAQATLSLAELCYDRTGVRSRTEWSLRVEGRGREELLVRWLQEVYLLVEQESWLTGEVGSLRLEAGVAEGVLTGEPIDRGRHTLHTEIKAITYHGMAIERDEDGRWRTLVIVDV